MKVSLPNTAYITNTYDTLARLLGTWLKKSDQTTLNSHQYPYDPGNQRTQQVFNAGSTYNYTYDNIGQLKVADSATASEDRGYTYDTAWNLNYRTNNGSLGTFAVDGLNQLTSAPNGSTTYDNNGNLIISHNEACTYEYDGENQLIQFARFQDKLAQFVYDGWGGCGFGGNTAMWALPRGRTCPIRRAATGNWIRKRATSMTSGGFLLCKDQRKLLLLRGGSRHPL